MRPEGRFSLTGLFVITQSVPFSCAAPKASLESGAFFAPMCGYSGKVGKKVLEWLVKLCRIEVK